MSQESKELSNKLTVEAQPANPTQKESDNKQASDTMMSSLLNFMKAFESLGINDMPEMKEIRALEQGSQGLQSSPQLQAAVTQKSASRSAATPNSTTALQESPIVSSPQSSEVAAAPEAVLQNHNTVFAALCEQYKHLPQKLNQFTFRLKMMSFIPKMQEISFLKEFNAYQAQCIEKNEKKELERQQQLTTDIQKTSVLLEEIYNKSGSDCDKFYKEIYSKFDTVYRKLPAFEPTKQLLKNITDLTYSLTRVFTDLSKKMTSITPPVAQRLIAFLEKFKSNNKVYDLVNCLPSSVKKLASTLVTKERESTITAFKAIQNLLEQNSLYFKRLQLYIPSQVVEHYYEKKEDGVKIDFTPYNCTYFQSLMKKINAEIHALKALFKECYHNDDFSFSLLELHLSSIEEIKTQFLEQLKKIDETSHNYFFICVLLETEIVNLIQSIKNIFKEDAAFLAKKPDNFFKFIIRKQLQDMKAQAAEKARVAALSAPPMTHAEAIIQEKKNQKALEKERRAANFSGSQAQGTAQGTAQKQMLLLANTKGIGSNNNKGEQKISSEETIPKPVLSKDEIHKKIMKKMTTLNPTDVETLKLVLGKVTPHFEIEEDKVIQLANHLGLEAGQIKNGFIIKIGNQSISADWEHSGNKHTLVGDFIRKLKSVFEAYDITLERVEKIFENNVSVSSSIPPSASKPITNPTSVQSVQSVQSDSKNNKSKRKKRGKKR